MYIGEWLDVTWRHAIVFRGGVSGSWWWCDVKDGREVELKNAGEVERTSLADCKNVCGLWLTMILSWDVLTIFPAFWAFVRFRRLFQNSRRGGSWRRDGDAKACDSEFGRKGGGWVAGGWWVICCYSLLHVYLVRFVDGICLMRCLAFLAVKRFLDEMSSCLLSNFVFKMWYKDGWDWVYTSFIGRCVVLGVQVGWWFVVGEMNVSWVMVGESASALGDKRLYWRRFSWGLGWWSDVYNLKNVCLVWAVWVFWSGLCFVILFLRVELWM